jgi:ATP-dependent exoDNAse (exonuclease V) beta subunit
LIARIEKIFSDENPNEGVCLSTIHKAKGLESDNVYIACASKLPSTSSKKDWEKEQEKNLAYVAYTRAKHKLGFIDEKEVPPNGSVMDYNQIISDLDYIEEKVCKITGVKLIKHAENSEMSRFRLRNTPNADMHSNDNKTIMQKNEGGKASSSDDLLTELLNL